MCGAWWLAGLLTLAAGVCCGGGGSLRSALEALQRRQRARTGASLYSHTRPQPAVFQIYPPAALPALYDDEPFEFDEEEIPENVPQKYIIKYLKDEPSQNNYITNNEKIVRSDREHKQSAFRERSHKHDDESGRLEKLFAERGETENKKTEKHNSDAEYAMLLNKLWSKYKGNHQDQVQISPENKERKIQKRQYPDDDGWGPVAFKRKRSPPENDNNEGDEDYPTLEYPLQQSDRYKYTIDEQQPSLEPNVDEHDDYIAFEPLEGDTLELPTYGDEYSYDVKKFPVTKRGGGSYQNVEKKRSVNKQRQINFLSSSGTDPKVIRDLSKIFGQPEFKSIKSPVKRSYKNEDSHESKPPQIAAAPQEHAHDHNESHVHDDGSHEHQGHAIHPPAIAGKEEEVVPNQHSHHHPISLKKKSIDWSQYFGIDKRKKKSVPYISASDDSFVKQYEDTFDRELELASHKKVKRGLTDNKPIDESEIEINRASIAMRSGGKRNSNQKGDSKLDSIDRKLAGVESVILDEALHVSHHVDMDSKEEQQLKENMLSRLAAAYNLEKMRKALKDFKKTLNSEEYKQINKNIEKSVEKRIAVKKEKAELKHEDVLSSQMTKVIGNSITEDFESERGAGHYLDGAGDVPFSEGYMGGSGTHRPPLPYLSGIEGECKSLQEIVRQCRGIDLLAGDRAQLFLPLCSLHQICYLCGVSAPTTCDLMFVSEADTVCEGDGACARTARSALMAMRELHDGLAENADGECEPCLADALRRSVGWSDAIAR